MLAGVSIVLSSLWLLSSSAQERLIVLAVAIMINTVVCLIALLWWHDRIMPIFELGVVCVVVTGVYCIVPPLGYLLADMQWSPFTDARIYRLWPAPEDVGRFIWRHVVYLAALATGYACVRGRAFIGTAAIRPEAPGTLPSVAILIGILTVYFAL